MMRTRAASRRMLTVALTGALLAGGLAGCGVAAPVDNRQTEEATVDYGDVSEAVSEAVPRVVRVERLSRSRDGFGYRLSAGLITDSAEPFTPEELDAVAETIWRTLPWEPGTVKLVAGAEEGGPVDLRAAAAELEPLTVTNAGQGGVSLTDLKVRYGAWSAPE